MDVAALDVQLGGRGVEVLVLEFADGPSVHGVGVFGTEPCYVEMVHSAADLLVGGKADLDRTVLEFWMFHDVLGGGHDFGHSGLVIGSEQGVAVGGDQGLTDIVQQLGKFFRVENHAFSLVESDGLAVIIFDNPWLDTASRSIGRGVHMGDESYGGDVLFYVGGDGGHQVAVFVQLYILQSHGLQLFAELVQEANCLLVLGWLWESGFDVVSNATYLRNLSTIFSISKIFN